MQIRNFTQTEAMYLETVCNFTPDEAKLFQLRLQDVSLEECAERMQTSVPTISRIPKRVIEKIRKEM